MAKKIGTKIWLPSSAIDPLTKYRTPHRADIEAKDFGNGGYTSVHVLPEFIDCKMEISLTRHLQVAWWLNRGNVR
jgi:hypothetical protein